MIQSWSLPSLRFQHDGGPGSARRLENRKR
jgi:hypothetical protein